jgi:uncharacterized protein (TIGR02118 family)
MIKMSVYYPADGGSKFDHDYYRTRHMPLLRERLGDACLRYEIDRGLAGREPGSAPGFVAACHVYSPESGDIPGGVGSPPCGDRRGRRQLYGHRPRRADQRSR